MAQRTIPTSKLAVDDGTRVRSVVVVLDRTLENASDQRNTYQLVLASSHEAAIESVAHYRTDVQRTICTNYESAMSVIRDQMNMGAQFRFSPAAASA